MKNQLLVALALVLVAAVAIMAINMRDTAPSLPSGFSSSSNPSYQKLVNYLTSEEGQPDYQSGLTTAIELSQWPAVYRQSVQQLGTPPATAEELWAQVNALLPNAKLGYGASELSKSQLALTLSPTAAGTSCEALTKGCAVWLTIQNAPTALWGTYYLLEHERKQAGLTQWSQIRNDGQAALSGESQQKLAREREARLSLIQTPDGEPLVQLGRTQNIAIRLQTAFEYQADIAYYKAQQE